MNQMLYLQKIATYLAMFSEQVTILNTSNEYAVNTHAEYFIAGLLNKVYGYGLKNVNDEQHNQPAIDLLDDVTGIAVQVTANTSGEKAYDTIRKYYNHQVYLRASRLIFFSLKQVKKPDQRILNEKIAASCATGAPLLAMNIENDFLDTSSLYRHLRALNDPQHTFEVYDYLKQHFESLEKQHQLEPYYAQLQQMFFETVMDDAEGMTLNSIYVDPGFLVHRDAFFDADKKTASSENFLEVDTRYKLSEFVNDFLQGDNTLGFEKKARLLLLLGYPGQGKSSFVKSFLHQYIQEGRHKTKPCYYYQLRNIRQVKNFIADPLKILHDEACRQLGFQLDYYRFPNAVLLLDGLDELYMKDNLRMDEIDRLVSELIHLTQRFAGLQVVLTSRYGYVDDDKLKKACIIIAQLAPFSPDDQLNWLNKYKVFHPDGWLSENTLTLMQIKNSLVYVRELIRQPLLLYMVASLHENFVRDTNRSQIYNQLFTELIDRKYSTEGQLEIFQQLDKNTLRNFIRDVAFAIHASGDGYITSADLMEARFTKNFLECIPEVSLRDSIKGVMIAFYFKETESPIGGNDSENYAIEFLHKSLQEYMTAEKIVVTISTEFLEQRRSSGRYLIDSFEQAADLLQWLFRRPLTDELQDYINQLVNELPKETRKQLAGRLLFHLDSLLETDFMRRYDLEEDLSPTEICLNVFHGYWHFVSCLRLDQNYLSDNRRLDFIRLVTLLSNDRGEVKNLSFDYQDLSGYEISNCHFVNCFFSYTQFKNVAFDNVNFYFPHLFHTSFTNCSFSNMHFQHGDITSSTFKDIIYYNCQFDTVFLVNTVFDHWDGFDADLFYEELGEHRQLIDTCTFRNCNMAEKSLKYLREAGKDCVFEDIDTKEPDNDGYEDLGATPEEHFKHISTGPAAWPENYKRLLAAIT